MAKMIFIQYCPDDQLSGCMVLSFKAELCYRRLQDLIYTNSDQLFDDDIIWELACRGFNEDMKSVRDELIKKRKIYIENDQIKNKRCSEEIQAANQRHEKAKNAALARHEQKPSKSQAHAQSLPTINYKLETINHITNNQKNIYTQEFDIFWRKYVLDENDTRSTKWDSYQQWKKLKAEDKESLGDKFITYKRQKGDYYKALERFIRKKIYLEITPEKEMSEEDFKEWKFNSDVDMRRKGMKPLSWSVGYIQQLDEFIEKNPG
jgi:uncharacterized protein YdaU (DUF1376 family)